MANRVKASSSNDNNPPSTASTGLMPAGVDADVTSRPRNRHVRGSTGGNTVTATASHLSPGRSRGPSPLPSAHIGAGCGSIGRKVQASGRSSPANSSFSQGLLEGSWTPSWTSVQDFASSLLSGGESGYNSDRSRPTSSNGNQRRQRLTWKGFGMTVARSSSANRRQLPESWGPAPPAASSGPGAADVAGGSLAEREAALKAMKTASVLESHDGVNGGLDVAGRYKRRNSDETSAAHEPATEEQLVYLHHVQPGDTYAGIVLRYRCQEHALRKSNGLWSRDNIQVRKYLVIPVDACEMKGRPCDPPSAYDGQINHLAHTARTETNSSNGANASTQPLHDEFFGSLRGKSQSLPEEARPWTHVRWVKLDGLQHPVEIVRVSRRAMGFFPPRRKKSITTTMSNFSTPRHSLDLTRAQTGSDTAAESLGQESPCRQSSHSARPTSLGTSATRSRVNSLGPADGVPTWMRRPGGVGSMGKSVKVPGPARDSLNAWVNKRLPGFGIDSLPSMSVMGSETAHFGFNSTNEEDRRGIVESPFEEGREASTPPQQGIGIEQAAATVETWLRGAWARRSATPGGLASTRIRPEELNLIELADTGSDDGRAATPSRIPEASVPTLGFHSASWRGDGEGQVRGRTAGPGFAKGKKAE